MARLIVNPDSTLAWEIELQPGVNSLGRDGQNDFPIEHPSVSSTHCQIILLSSGVIIKDLGSIGGTFINNTLVEEALLLPGQLFRVGEVMMRLEADAVSATPTTSPVVATTGSFCKSHPKATAHYYCAKCSGAFCELCVNTRMINGRPTKFCRACGGECVSLQPEEIQEAQKFAALIGGAFKYPFKHDGIIILVTGTIFYSALNFLSSHAMFFGLILGVFGTGYLFSYMQRIITASASRENRMPDWPDFTDWSDVTGPFLQLLGTVFISFGLAIVMFTMSIHMKDQAPPWLDWALPAAIGFGCIYFPMSYLAVAMFDSIGAVNPLLIIPSMLRIPAAYLLAIVLLASIFVANWAGNSFLETALPIPFVPDIISEFLGLYLLTVEMRILGLLYWTKKGELGWFRH